MTRTDRGKLHFSDSENNCFRFMTRFPARESKAAKHTYERAARKNGIIKPEKHTDTHWHWHTHTQRERDCSQVLLFAPIFVFDEVSPFYFLFISSLLLHFLILITFHSWSALLPSGIPEPAER